MLRARGRGAVPNVRRPAASVRVPSQPAQARGPRVAHSGQVDRPAVFARHHGTSATPDAPKKGGGVGGFVASLGKRETWKHFWEVAKAEGRHYKHGSIVFWDNLKVAWKIGREKVLKNKRLTRSERLQLSRTTMDFLKLGNLIPIIVIPAAEFALPFILKLWPGFLPSTYATTEQIQGKMNAAIKQKEEILSTLQTSTEDLFRKVRFESVGLKNDDAVAAWQKMRTGAIPLDTQEILHFAQLFHELFALDKLSRRKLESVCQFFGLPNKGSDDFLINSIRIKMRMLREDDEEILEEGVYNLSDIDLRDANIDRGVKGVKLEREQLIKLLREWIELSSHALPPYLLVLSRSFTMSDRVNAKIAQLEKLEQHVEKLEKIAPDAAAASKAKAKLEEVKEEVRRTIETEAAKPAPAPEAKVMSTAVPNELKDKILEVASTLATAEKEVTTQGSTMHSDAAERVSRAIEEMIAALEKDEKLDQHKKDKIYLLQQFALFDKDKNGTITAEELKQVLTKMGEPLPDDSVREFVATVDKNKDGQITFEELQNVLSLIEKAKAPKAKEAQKQAK